MLTESILSLLFGIINLLISLIPKIELPSGFIAGIEQSRFILDLASYFLPMGTFFTCFSVFLVLNNARLIVSIFNFIVRKIPGIS